MKNDENNLKALCQKLGVDVIGGYFLIGIVKQYRGVQFLKKPLLYNPFLVPQNPKIFFLVTFCCIYATIFDLKKKQLDPKKL